MSSGQNEGNFQIQNQEMRLFAACKTWATVLPEKRRVLPAITLYRTVMVVWWFDFAGVLRARGELLHCFDWLVGSKKVGNSKNNLKEICKG